MTALQRVSVAQVGVGGFGATRRKWLRETELFRVVAVHDWDRRAMEAAADEEGAVVCERFEDLLRVPGVEAIVLSTGAKHHAEQVIAALEAGLHVFVEKPLCSTPEELASVLRAADARPDLVVAVGHNDHLHEPYSKLIRGLIDAGEIGSPVSVCATTAHGGGFHIRDGDWRGDPDRNPGGMLFHCGVHKLHELMFYLGPIRRVFASMRYDLHTTPTADAAVCQLEFESGVIGSLHAYHVTPHRHEISIYGTRANLYYECFHAEHGTLLERQDILLSRELQPRRRLVADGKGDPASSLHSFFRAIREGVRCYPSLMDGARALQVVFAAERSAKEGVAVEVEPLEPAPLRGGAIDGEGNGVVTGERLRLHA